MGADGGSKVITEREQTKEWAGERQVFTERKARKSLNCRTRRGGGSQGSTAILGLLRAEARERARMERTLPSTFCDRE